jgi:cytochrome c-type biogenesis protein CcmF
MYGASFIPELGHFALALAVAFAGAQAIAGIAGPGFKRTAWVQAAPGLALGQWLALALAFYCLIASAVSDDFSVLNIAENSARDKPLLYKITGAWGNHEGSILLWGFILACCGAAVSLFGRNLPSLLRARVLGVLGGTSVGFLLFSLLTSNPFVRLWPPAVDGRGMNPLLQDPGLAFHPPILYTGYVGFAVPFAFAIAALIEGRVDAAWGRWVRPWAVAAWAFLTCGIALGSWWAYYELGWGGYWFWDPVENASLMPWLTGTALMHSAIVVEKRESLKVWTVLLAIGTFALSLSGTFMVRSGLLNSVHSFASDPARGIFILALLGIVIGGSFLLFALRAGNLSAGGIYAPLSREGALIVNNILLCSIASVVIVGTLYPPFADLLIGQKISVGAPFFNATVLPLAIPTFVAMAMGPLLPWKRGRLQPLLRHAWMTALVAVLVAGVARFGAPSLAAAGFGAAAWLIIGSFAEVIERTLFLRTSPGNAWRRARGLPVAVLGAAIAHAGMGVTVAGISGSALSTQKIVAVKPGDNFASGGYEWTLEKLETVDGPNYTARVATVTASRNGVVQHRMMPERRNFTAQGQVVSDVAIDTNLLRDLYVALGDERDGEAVLRVHNNFLAPLIWIGALIMALGGALSLLDRRLRVGAPVPAQKKPEVLA